MDRFSFFNAANSTFFDELYQEYLKNPDSVDSSWRSFFQGYDFQNQSYNTNDDFIPEEISKEFQVINLINDYRKRGHLFTQTNPVRARRVYSPKLDFKNFGLKDSDLNTVFQAGNEVGIGASKLSKIIEHLNLVYCQSIGVEYMYIRDSLEIDWIKQFIHQNNNHAAFSIEEKKEILKKLNQAVAFEEFLGKKYVGQKRFSLEGAESIIPALHQTIQLGIFLGVEDFVFGMAHRGRLNILANIFEKPYESMFKEFDGIEYMEDEFDGDVKYHMGYNANISFKNQSASLKLVPNPSHLEAVNSVVQGICRAKIEKDHKNNEKKVFPILIHGDAAISGQGVVYENLQMSQLKGYKTGGSLHIVINNQVGFTTNYLDGRSSTYCTDIAKTTLSPVLHVNGDDVEALIHALSFAVQYRQKFGKDVFIDLLCYRKYGHNEGDEPRFTQPKLYKAIENHLNPFQIYAQNLLKDKVVSHEDLEFIQNNFKSILEKKLQDSKKIGKVKVKSVLEKDWVPFYKAKSVDFLANVSTKITLNQLEEVADKITTLPKEHHFHRKTLRLFQERRKMVFEDKKIDWGMAECLAYGSLIQEGFGVRISGQDVERGTFSHRHAIVKSINSETSVSIFQQICKHENQFQIYNSFLSEYAVLGFDYGYSLVSPNKLTIWEAQFGDFSNGAQIIIDQYISSAEEKWNIQSGLVLYLPHGYEGQGAEHSSARMERYLQLCAQYNIQVINCTTPANLFHMLRRHMKRKFRKPLILFSPKSLLRHPECMSITDEFTSGSFQEIIDNYNGSSSSITKIVFVTGKLFYDLNETKQKLKNKDILLVRIEQLYPFPKRKLQAIIKKYNKAKEYIWAQEEPENMGAWSFVLQNLGKIIPIKLVSRRLSAAPASGSSKKFNKRQELILNKIFN